MPLVLADRVRETTTTTGTGTISLAGPVSGFQGFSTAIGNANTTYYTIVDAATGAWEVGLGTYTSAGSTLARTTVFSSSNSDALVPFAAGTKDVFVTQPAERAVYVLGAGTGLAAGAAAFTANGVPYANSTSTLATSANLTFNGTTFSAFTIGSSRIDPRTSTSAATATLTPDISAFDQYNLTAQDQALTVAAPTGTPVDGNKLILRILDNGTARAITWNATYTAIGTTLPTTTTASKMLYVGCIYNSTNTRWDVVAVTTQA